MVIAGLAAIEAFLNRHAGARAPINRWIELVEPAAWQNIIEVRRSLPTADAIKGTDLTCFNIGGNNYRLLTVISYERQQVTIRELMTHAEYNKKYAR